MKKLHLIAAGILFAACSYGNNETASVMQRVFDADRKADAAWEKCDTMEKFKARRAMLREKTIATLGGFPEKTPLNAKTFSVVKRDGYKIEKVAFESRPGIHVTALLYLPDSPEFKAPYPGIILPCGHSANGKGAEAYQRGCVMGAKEGFAVMIYDPFDQGERIQNSPGGISVHGHNTAGIKSSLVGKSMALYRVWDGIRAIDYLVSRKDIDPGKIGCMGNSGGGTLTTYISALDPRVKAACPACFVSSVREVVEHCGPQDAEQCIFGQLEFGLNHAGFVLMAEGAIRLQVSEGDFFPVKGSIETFELVKRVSTKLGIADRYDMTIVKGPHGWKESSRRSSLDWMRKWLMGDNSIKRTQEDYRKLDIGFDHKKVDCGLPKPEYNVTENGKVSSLPGERTIYDLVRDEAAKAKRAAKCTRETVSCEGASTLVFDAKGTPVHVFYGTKAPSEELAVLYHLLGTSLVEERAKEIEAAVRAEMKKTGKPPVVVAHESWCPAVAFAYAKAPECFSGIRCVKAPDSWKKAIEENGKYLFSSSVTGGYLKADWVDLLPANTTFEK